MKQQDWTEQLRQKLGNHVEPVPEDLWSRIEQQLPDQPQSTRSGVAYRWLAAAAVAVLMITGGVYIFHRADPNARPPRDGAGRVATTQNGGAVSEEPTPGDVPRLVARWQPRRPSSPVEKRPVGSVISPSDYSNGTGETVDKEDIVVEKSDELDLREQQMTVSRDEDVRVEEPQGKTESARVMAQMGREPTGAATQAWPQDLGVRHRETPRRFTIGYHVADNLASSERTEPVRMSQQEANGYLAMAYSEPGSMRKAPAVMYLTNYKEVERHSQPLAFGLTFDYHLTPVLSLRSGLVYTMAKSDFVHQLGKTTIEDHQKLTYIGVPLVLSRELWQSGAFHVYGSAGAEADFNVRATVESGGMRQTIDNDRVQFSLSGAVGAELRGRSGASVYVEPGLRWYPDNGSDVRNSFKERPLSPVLQMGVRMNFGRR